MEDGFDHGAAGQDPLSLLRSAASERLRQMLGPDGLAQANPLQLAEMANEALDGLVIAAKVTPTLAEQRQLLRDVVDTLRAERAAAAPAAADGGRGAGIRPAGRPAGGLRGEERPRGQEQARAAGQGAGDAAPDAAHRHLGRLGAGAGGAAQPDRRDRRGDHRRPEDPAERDRAEVDRAAPGGRHGGAGAARAAAQGRRRHRHHGQRPVQVYVERKGKLELTDVQFRDDAHVLHVAHPHRRPRSAAGSTSRSPLVDARLPDGSRVNVIIPPLAIDGPTHLDPQVLQEADHARRDGAAEQHLRRHGDGAEDRRRARGSTS